MTPEEQERVRRIAAIDLRIEMQTAYDEKMGEVEKKQEEIRE